MNILFISSLNTGRSIMAEAIMNRVSNGRFVAFSAGAAPGKAVDTLALELLGREGYDLTGLAPSALDRFVKLPALRIDLAITLCNNGQGEVCRIPPDIAVVAHWDVPDPCLETDRRAHARAYERALRMLERRCLDMMGMPPDIEADPKRLTSYVDMIGWGNHAYAADGQALAGDVRRASFHARGS